MAQKSNESQALAILRVMKAEGVVLTEEQELQLKPILKSEAEHRLVLLKKQEKEMLIDKLYRLAKFKRLLFLFEKEQAGQQLNDEERTIVARAISDVKILKNISEKLEPVCERRSFIEKTSRLLGLHQEPKAQITIPELVDCDALPARERAEVKKANHYSEAALKSSLGHKQEKMHGYIISEVERKAMLEQDRAIMEKWEKWENEQ